LMQYVLIILGGLGLLNLFVQLTKKNISVSNSLKWFVTCLAMIIIAIDPEISNRMANLFGIGRGADLIMYAAFVFVFFLIFKILLRLNKIDKQISKLVTHIAVKDAKKNYNNESNKE
jgi:small membrane protein